jgi:hypothetical protein
MAVGGKRAYTNNDDVTWCALSSVWGCAVSKLAGRRGMSVCLSVCIQGNNDI